MSRDYKSRKSSSTKNNRKRGSLIWGLFIGYAMGLISAIGVWVYLSQAPSPFLSEEEKKTSNGTVSSKYDANKSQVSNPVSSTAFKNEITQENEKPRFDFYTILPGIEEPATEQEFKQAIIQQPALQQQPTGQQSVPEKPRIDEPKIDTKLIAKENYFLQVGSFRKTDEAENLKVRLALLGVIASVQSTDLSEKGIWHRVRIGPFTQMAEVNEVRATLQQNGIEANFIKAKK